MDMGKIIQKMKQKARELKKELFVLYMAVRDKRVGWLPKIVTGLVLAYALSPIDLIPDFIPVIGYLDDLILVPLGIKLAIRLIPKEILAEYRKKIEETPPAELPKTWGFAVFIIIIWLVLAGWVGKVIFDAVRG
jgi:uncharacterized membrane protein YkvA (DUF1232 family)